MTKICKTCGGEGADKTGFGIGLSVLWYHSNEADCIRHLRACAKRAELLLRIRTADDERIEAAGGAEAILKRLDALGKELAGTSVWLRGGKSIEVVIYEYFRQERELKVATERAETAETRLAELEAAARWRPVADPPGRAGYYKTACIDLPSETDRVYYSRVGGWDYDIDFWQPLPAGGYGAKEN